jgi:uncharacterized protein with NRDE domain
MCLIAFAVAAHPAYPLVVLANRDELYARPARPAHAWDDAPELFGGRDLEKGGTWLAVSRAGRVAAVTNVRHPGARREGLSRGALVRDALLRDADPATFARGLDRARYPAFNLLLGDGAGLFYATEESDGLVHCAQGLHALSNARLDVSWPKADRAREQLGALLDVPVFDVAAAFDVLGSRDRADDGALPHTGVPIDLERALSPAFLAMDAYGTRASTVVVWNANGTIRFAERSFGPGGALLGEVDVTLATS